MALTVACECGSRTRVVASQAGGTIACDCGKRVVVPALSQLRKSGDDGDAPTTAIQRVRDLIAGGKLPSNTSCPFSGANADQVVYFRVECEKRWIRRESDDGWQLVGLFLFGWFGFFLSLFCKRQAEVLGHDVAIVVPLRVHPCALTSLQRMRQRELRDALRRVPAYGHLLRDYPKANIEALEAAA
jgi:hypothetical protein